ncbi:MAG: right-handed parallel beta-helix repeat-containing protein [Pseudomonadota bacterium]
MKRWTYAFLLCSQLLPAVSLACNTTLSPGSNVISNAVNASPNGAVICLNNGIYAQTVQVALKSNQRLTGLGTRNNAKITFQGVNRAVTMKLGSKLNHVTLEGLDPNGTAEYGVLAFNAGNNQVWDVGIENFQIGVGLNGSPNGRITSVHISDTGNPFNTLPDPAIWIRNSDNTRVRFGRIDGASNGPGGDGEISCFSSRFLEIDGLNVIDSGASAIYLVGCADAVVENTVVHRAGEWGIDVVDGSSNFTARNNEVWWSNFAGSVYDETDNGPGTYENNDFRNNNLGGVANCTGVAVNGTQSNVTMIGNVVTPGPQTCSPPT